MILANLRFSEEKYAMLGHNITDYTSGKNVENNNNNNNEKNEKKTLHKPLVQYSSNAKGVFAQVRHAYNFNVT